MIIAVDDSLVTYSLKQAFTSENDQEINYICQRITEAVERMQKPLTMFCKQDIEDYMKDHDPNYLKAAPLKRLYEALIDHLEEFAK